ncbi:hypothetical protein [Methylobacterium haplocladii]|uniref:Uncharacterized protein n=1 Tax=Methylobacterium haplocladii TaxID=1176176 RepID=A0A512IK78_9HYPH|nr:hypothetical protein [Methylobacterium haplocladii]GEO98094.1 hypothetical protein MHA02_04820 [Methylobacterium haplocladii]GLS59055.1 hypothetical protein GCM10007887_17210 [Methylobacterium haplocladii]
MSITIENAEAEALLSESSAMRHSSQPDRLLDLPRRVRERLAREIAGGLESARLLREGLNRRTLIDPRPIDEILAYDENGLPA